MTRLRISHDGTVRSLWTDAIGWQSLGTLSVRRASYVEFDAHVQKWTVRASRPRSRTVQFLQWLTGRPFGVILHRADSRELALAWEQRHYGIGGPGWDELIMPVRRTVVHADVGQRGER